MIPTLMGRWQVRLFLFAVIGLPVTFFYTLWTLIFGLNGWPFLTVAGQFYGFLIAILLLGLILDPLYIFIQKFRWDRDWPFAYQLFFSFVELGIVLTMARVGWVPWLSETFFNLPGALGIAIGHFIWVFIPSFIALLGLIQIFFVRWRFKAGRFGRL